MRLPMQPLPRPTKIVVSVSIVPHKVHPPKSNAKKGVVSEVFRGKRELNLRQDRALSERFGVAPAVFIEASQTGRAA